MSRKVSTSSFTKLHAKRARPFKIKRRLGLNAYLIELPLDYNVSSIFNMANLTKYKGEEDVVVHEAPFGYLLLLQVMTNLKPFLTINSLHLDKEVMINT